MALAPGDRLGPYRVEAPLGAGGMGEVYRTHDTRLGRDVALKVLREQESVGRFEREARAVAALSHPNILALVRALVPADRAGILSIYEVALADDDRWYVYNPWKLESSLYVAERAGSEGESTVPGRAQGR